jgi:hypothetical protein
MSDTSKDKFFKNNQEMNIKDYESLGHMISDCDYWITTEALTKEEIKKKYPISSKEAFDNLEQINNKQP